MTEAASDTQRPRTDAELAFDEYWPKFKAKRRLPDGSYLLMSGDDVLHRLTFLAGWEAHAEHQRLWAPE